jgi:nicotinic acid mononucleotide adenylyltransferase
MCRLATESSDWLDVGYWEAAQHFFVDFGAVTKETDRFLRETFSKELAETKLTPFYLCGADLVMRCRLWKSRSFGVIGVARGGWSIPEKLVPDITRAIKENRDEDGEKRFFFVTVETPDVSSTKIRKHLVAMERTELLELTFENVANYLLDLKREGVLGKSSFDRCVEAEEEKHKIAESNSDHDPPKSACMIS